MIGQVFVTLAWKLHVILSLKVLDQDLSDMAWLKLLPLYHSRVSPHGVCSEGVPGLHGPD